MKTIRDKRDRIQKKALAEGYLKYASEFRCLRLSEIRAIMDFAPSIHHVAFAIIGLSTGLRPEDHADLQVADWDRESGALFFREGKLNRKNKSPSGRYVANPHTSTVVRLILANPEFFDISLKSWIYSARA